MAGRNAIAQRLDRLSDQWNEFASNEEARILRWLIREDELRMIETFVQFEQDARAGEIPDLFLRFNEPFEDVNTYGAVLRESLIEQYELAKEELEDSGMDSGWNPPSAEGRHSLIAFLEACVSLQEHYADSMEKLAVVLTPDRVASDYEFQRWLWALPQQLPTTVRFAILDMIDAPAFDALAQANPERVVSVPAELDMPAAIEDLARTGGTAGPDGQFRVQFAAVAQALAKGDLDGARSSANGALAITREHNWPHLGAAVHMALAGGYLSAGKYNEAVILYRAADSVGAEVEESGEAVGSKLRLQAGFGMAAAYFAAHDAAGAASVYQALVPQAEKAGDAVMLLECWRMAGHCYELAGDPGNAWDSGLRALDAAETLTPENRAQSTLPFAGDALLRIAKDSPEHMQIVDARMTELLGTPDWRALVAAALEPS